MKGIVDDSGRAILPIKILCPKYPTGVQIDTWIDTGFTGDLVLPQIVIDDLRLEMKVRSMASWQTAQELSYRPITASWNGSVS